LPINHLSLVVGRALGIIIVTVRGELDSSGCDMLEGMLTDLIDGQGNRKVAVDLAEAIVEPEAQKVFTAAAQRARRRGAEFIVLNGVSPDQPLSTAAARHAHPTGPSMIGSTAVSASAGKSRC